MDAPLFVMGHSHGSLVTAIAAIERGIDCAGVILESPLFGLRLPIPGWKRLIGVIGARFMPRLPVASGVGAQLLSRDLEMIKETQGDRLCLGIATPRWFAGALAAQLEARNRAGEFKLPMFVLIAGDDCLVDSAAAVDFCNHAGSTSKSVKTYPEYRHEILRDLGREAIFEDVLQWMRGMGAGDWDIPPARQT